MSVVVDIKKFYKRGLIDAMMFGYVNALRFNIPSASIENAIKNFQKHHNLDEDNFNVDSAKVIYNRMQNEYNEAMKEKH